MTEIGLLKEAGAVAFTDGDRSIANARVMRRALAYAATFDALVVGHAEDPELVGGRRRSPKANSPRGWAFPPRPPLAEAIIVERDIRLVELTGARYHFGQISTRAALDAIAAAKARGPAHHLRRLRPSSAAQRAGCRRLLHLPQSEAAAALRSRPRRHGGRRGRRHHRRDRLQP